VRLVAWRLAGGHFAHKSVIMGLIPVPKRLLSAAVSMGLKGPEGSARIDELVPELAGIPPEELERLWEYGQWLNPDKPI